MAVKVQYIDLKDRFHSDVGTVEFLLDTIGFVHPSFNFSWMIKELKETLKQELDFINEGRNAEKCARDLRHLRFIYVPEIFWEYSSKVEPN